MMTHENLSLLPKSLRIFYISLLSVICCESPIKKNPLAQINHTSWTMPHFYYKKEYKNVDLYLIAIL